MIHEWYYQLLFELTIVMEKACWVKDLAHNMRYKFGWVEAHQNNYNKKIYMYKDLAHNMR